MVLSFKLYRLIYKIYRRAKFLLSVLVKGGDIFIVDIDNTVANTFPLLLQDSCLKLVYQRANCFSNVVDFINEQRHAGKAVFFLSARDSQYYKVTEDWLNRNVFGGFNELLLVSSANEKLIYLKLLVFCKKKVFYIDDLSYGHETGTVRYFDNLIRRVSELPIVYIGYPELRRLHESEKLKLVIVESKFVII